MNNTVIIVDEDSNIRSSFSNVFREDGVNVLAAENGETGLDLLRKNSPAVVVSDSALPRNERDPFP